ncbi:MAG: hypothetical protein WD696_01655 [Bryobacteraceae bacterium]
MRIAINLASQPFRRDRPVLFASAVVGVLLVALLAVLISIAGVERSRLADTWDAIAGLERDLSVLAAQQAAVEKVIREPANAEVLERSQFLNLLLFRKGISWTKIFADLEKIMPYNVRVISIRPQVNQQNQVYLEMFVGAESNEPIVELLIRLENSELFGAPTVQNSQSPSQAEPLYRTRLSVNYAQKL